MDSLSSYVWIFWFTRKSLRLAYLCTLELRRGSLVLPTTPSSVACLSYWLRFSYSRCFFAIHCFQFRGDHELAQCTRLHPGSNPAKTKAGSFTSANNYFYNYGVYAVCLPPHLFHYMQGNIIEGIRNLTLSPPENNSLTLNPPSLQGPGRHNPPLPRHIERH